MLTLATVRPAWCVVAERPVRRWSEGVESADWARLPVSALALVVAAKNGFLRIAALDYERSPILAPSVAVIIGVLIPFASLANALLGGSPALLYWYILSAIAVACLAVLDAWGWRTPGLVLALAATLTWAVTLPLYAIWSLTAHFMGGPLQNAAVAGLIIGTFLYAVLAVSGSLLRRAADHDLIDEFGAGSIAVVAIPLLYIIYWIVLYAAARQNVDVSDRNWLSLGVFILSDVLFLATANLMLNHWQVSKSSFSGVGVYFATALLALIASFAIVGSGDPNGLGEWLSTVPVAIWSILPMCLIYCALIKLIGQMRSWAAIREKSAFFVPGLAFCVTSAALAAVMLVVN